MRVRRSRDDVEDDGGDSRGNVAQQLHGVTFDPKRKRWKARIHFAGKERYIARFKTSREAAMAYDEVARAINATSPCCVRVRRRPLNFPGAPGHSDAAVRARAAAILALGSEEDGGGGGSGEEGLVMDDEDDNGSGGGGSVGCSQSLAHIAAQGGRSRDRDSNSTATPLSSRAGQPAGGSENGGAGGQLTACCGAALWPDGTWEDGGAWQGAAAAAAWTQRPEAGAGTAAAATAAAAAAAEAGAGAMWLQGGCLDSMIQHEEDLQARPAGAAASSGGEAGQPHHTPAAAPAMPAAAAPAPALPASEMHSDRGPFAGRGGAGLGEAGGLQPAAEAAVGVVGAAARPPLQPQPLGGMAELEQRASGSFSEASEAGPSASGSASTTLQRGAVHASAAAWRPLPQPPHVPQQQQQLPWQGPTLMASQAALPGCCSYEPVVHHHASAAPAPAAAPPPAALAGEWRVTPTHDRGLLPAPVAPRTQRPLDHADPDFLDSEELDDILTGWMHGGTDGRAAAAAGVAVGDEAAAWTAGQQQQQQQGPLLQGGTGPSMHTSSTGTGSSTPHATGLPHSGDHVQLQLWHQHQTQQQQQQSCHQQYQQQQQQRVAVLQPPQLLPLPACLPHGLPPAAAMPAPASAHTAGPGAGPAPAPAARHVVPAAAAAAAPAAAGSILAGLCGRGDALAAASSCLHALLDLRTLLLLHTEEHGTLQTIDAFAASAQQQQQHHQAPGAGAAAASQLLQHLGPAVAHFQAGAVLSARLFALAVLQQLQQALSVLQVMLAAPHDSGQPAHSRHLKQLLAEWCACGLCGGADGAVNAAVLHLASLL